MVAAAGDYTYDAVYRLTIATGREHPTQAGLDQRDIPTPLPLPTDCAAIVNYQETYAYTKAGNLAALTHTSFLPSGPNVVTRKYAYDAVSNRLQTTTIGGAVSTYAHSARGDMIAMPHLGAMVWNHRDELIAATRTRIGNGPNPPPSPQLSNPVFFGYDLRGQRVRKVSESGSTVGDRVYVGPYELYCEHPLGGAPTLQRDSLHILDDRQRVVLVETLTNGSQELIRYQLTNNLGSAVLELDRNATLISYEEFHPYGTTAFEIQGSGIPLKRYRFNGKERDDATGLDYHGARYFAPWLGRWLSPDPSDRAGPNVYVGMGNNPVSRIDPDGAEDVPAASRGPSVDPNTGLVAITVDPKNPQQFARDVVKASEGGLLQTISNWWHHQIHPSPAELGIPGRFVTSEVKGPDGTAVRFSIDPSTDQVTPIMSVDPSNQKGVQRVLDASEHYSLSPSGGLGHLIHRAGAVGAQALAAWALFAEPAPVGRGIWDLGPAKRGIEAEKLLGGNLPPGFKTIDRALVKGPAAEEIASIKSIDLRLPGYQKPNAIYKKVTGYANKVARFKTAQKGAVRIVAGPATSRVLDLAVEPGAATRAQAAQLKAAVAAGKLKGVKVRIHAIR